MRVGDIIIDLAAPMHRALVAILAINANTTISTEQLIDELWNRNAPDGARATLQSYVSVVRRKCRDAGRDDLIETRAPGYVLRLAPSESDVGPFRQLISAAQQAEAAGAEDEAYERLRDALGLVSGAVLPSLDHLDTVRVFAADIDEHRRWATEHLVEADLAAGRAGEVVPRLREMVDSHPFEERMWGLLMRALAHSGRQADALRAYQDLRELLIDELGVEPGPEVRAIERAILDGDLGVAPSGTGGLRRTASTRRRITAPPHPTASLIGRLGELSDIDEALGTHRLVTITGPGGCGKTRIAAEVAALVRGRFDLVAWVELNTLDDGTTVADAIAAALGIYRRQTDGVLHLVADDVAGQRALVVVDNCEHVVEQASDTIAAVLGLAPDLTVIATSRERLMVAGELVVALPPLISASPLELTRSRFEKPSEAATMFIERAGLQAPEPQHLAVIEAICAQLDGIPLAIELAAPLVEAMTLDEIADRLLDRFRLLGDAHRSSRPQHRTLRAVVEWSHDLLSDDERSVFAALSIFRGPFSLDAADAVIRGIGHEALFVLPRLVRKSVVMADTSAKTSRYRLLETLRAYGAEQLATDPESEDLVTGAFVTHYKNEALRWARHQQTATVTAWLNEVGPEFPNFQAAVALAREVDVDAALAMIDTFQWYLHYLGQMAETREWLRHLAATQDLTLEQRTVAGTCQAAIANFSGDYGATTELAEDALAAARELGDIRRLNSALITRGTTATFEGNAERAAECFIESAPLSEQLGDLGGMAASMAFWGIAHRRLGEFEEAQRCFDQAFEGFSRLHDDRGLALVVCNLGRMAHQQGRLDRAAELTRRGLEMARQSLDPMTTAQAGLFCGHLALDTGDIRGALGHFETTLEHALILGNRTLSSAALEWMVVAGGARPHAVAVIDAFTTLRRNAPRTASARAEWDEAVARAEAELSATEHAALSAQGRAMDLDEAIAFARAAAADAQLS